MKLKQTKIPMELSEDNILKIAIEQGVIENEFNWRLIRLDDGLIKQSRDIVWILVEEMSITVEDNKPEVGSSLLMSPFNEFFTWYTTEITEIIEEKENYIKFKTKNSTYELYKL
jgi:hypothetical protein